MLSRVHTSTIVGVEAVPVEVEVDVRGAKELFSIIGLADGAVREARERVFTALVHSGFKPPGSVVVNLAPAGLKKEGTSFDLAIALAVLQASRQIHLPALEYTSVHGELGLDGRVKAIRGTCALAIGSLLQARRQIFVPQANIEEAQLIAGLNVVTAPTLIDAVSALSSSVPSANVGPRKANTQMLSRGPGLSEVWGQEKAKRALVLAAAGGHNVLLIGPPGCGKSMLAQRLPGLLPPLEERELLEVVQIHSVAGLAVEPFLSGHRPYRHPHQLVSEAGLIGGGPQVRPGEVSLAHAGVLFLDEFPEFGRSSLEALRAPLEDGRVTIARAKGCFTFPARFQLVAAMNPCPCGKLGSLRDSCTCTQSQVQNYLAKLSGPILDRIDIQVQMESIPADVLCNAARGHSPTKKEAADEEIRSQVHEVRDRAYQRQRCLNSQLALDRVASIWSVSSTAYELLTRSAEHFSLSARSFLRVLRLARTIADFDHSESVEATHVAEAISLRGLDQLQKYANPFRRRINAPSVLAAK